MDEVYQIETVPEDLIGHEEQLAEAWYAAVFPDFPVDTGNLRNHLWYEAVDGLVELNNDCIYASWQLDYAQPLSDKNDYYDYTEIWPELFKKACDEVRDSLMIDKIVEEELDQFFKDYPIDI